MVAEFIVPNLHVIFVHYPLALLTLGFLIELFGFLWPNSTIRNGARWMILFGALLSIPATFSGIYALYDIAQRNNPAGAEAVWVDAKAASPLLSQPHVWMVMKLHVIFQSIATGLSVLAAVIWLSCSDYARKLLRPPLMLLLLASIAAMIAGAWYAGESIYRHGVGIDTPSVATVPADRNFEYYLPVLEAHVIAAGVVIAIAMAAIGMSIRKITVKHEIIRDVSELSQEQKTIAEGSLRTPASSMAMLRSFNPGIELTVAPFAPAARFWLIAGLMAIATAAGGIYVLARDSDVSEIAAKTHQPIVKVLWQQIQPDKGQSMNRALGHVIGGVAIIVCAFALAAAIRYAPRRRIGMGILIVILLAAVGAQIWLGILLLYDTPQGSITHFNASESSAPAQAAMR